MTLYISPFSLHFLILSPFSRSPAARLQQVAQPCLRVSHDPERLKGRKDAVKRPTGSAFAFAIVA